LSAFSDRTKWPSRSTAKRSVIPERVNNLTVRASAIANVTHVDDVDTGNIEWYPIDI
jgi:hypothetical protein